jgi:hypothetical protein
MTLRRQILQDTYKKTLSPAACLGTDVEMKVVSRNQQMQAAGFELSRKYVKIPAFKLAQKLRVKHILCVVRGRAGNDWFASFMRRHPEISVRRAEGVSLSRDQGMNKEDSRNYFDLLKKTLLENRLMKKPGHIFNVDGTGFQLNKKPGNVLDKRGSKNVDLLKSVEKEETLSVIACCSAGGHLLPKKQSSPATRHGGAWGRGAIAPTHSRPRH